MQGLKALASSCRILQSARNNALQQGQAAFASMYARYVSGSAASSAGGGGLPDHPVDYLEPKMKMEIDYSPGPPGKVFIETCYGLVDYYKPYGEPPISEVEEELYDHATGLARIELEALERGEDLWAEEWQYGPWGTPENPKRVPSTNGQRQIGVVDPEDETWIHWHMLDLGDPPCQLIPGGEFYVLQPVEAPYWQYWD